MFTGIVEETGTVNSISRGGSSLVLGIECSFAEALEAGESVAVNGVCLTVTKKTKTSFCADVTPETFRRTSLNELAEGSAVNLERAMKADGRFGGHIVSGHVDGTGMLTDFVREENAVNIFVCVSRELGYYIIEKGSVTVDGISLTVAHVEHGSESCVFSVAVIPHTWENTVLCKKNKGSVVNIECDVIGKYVEHFLKGDDAEKNALSEMMSSFKSFH